MHGSRERERERGHVPTRIKSENEMPVRDSFDERLLSFRQTVTISSSAASMRFLSFSLTLLSNAIHLTLYSFVICYSRSKLCRLSHAINHFYLEPRLTRNYGPKVKLRKLFIRRCFISYNAMLSAYNSCKFITVSETVCNRVPSK